MLLRLSGFFCAHNPFFDGSPNVQLLTICYVGRVCTNTSWLAAEYLTLGLSSKYSNSKKNAITLFLCALAMVLLRVKCYDNKIDLLLHKT